MASARPDPLDSTRPREPRQGRDETLELSGAERRRRWLWWLASVLLVGLALTVVILVTSRPGGSEAAPLPRGSSGGVLAGMVGLVILFVLYGTWQHGQLLARESELRQIAAREDVLRERLDEVASLLEVTSALAEKLDLKAMLSLAAKRVLSCLEADHSAVYLFNPHDGRLDEVASCGARSRPANTASARPEEGVLGYVYGSREALAIESEEMRARLAAELGLTGTPHAAICAPIRFKQANLGVLCIARIDVPEPFAAVHARALQALAEHCGAAIVKDFHYQRNAHVSRAA